VEAAESTRMTAHVVDRYTLYRVVTDYAAAQPL